MSKGELFFDFQPFTLSFSSLYTKSPRFIVGSFQEGSPSYVQIFSQIENKTYQSIRRIENMLPPSYLLFSPIGDYTENDLFLLTDIDAKFYRFTNSDIHLQQVYSKGNNIPITCADWSKEQSHVQILCCTDGTAIFYDQTANTHISKISAHSNSILSVSFCPDSTCFITSGFDGSLRFFDPRDFHSSLLFYQSSLPIQKVMISPFNSNSVAFLPYNNTKIIISDKRFPNIPLSVVGPGDSVINAFGWSRSQPGKLVIASESKMIYGCELIPDQQYAICQKIGETNTPPESLVVGPEYIAISQSNSVLILKDLEQ